MYKFCIWSVAAFFATFCDAALSPEGDERIFKALEDSRLIAVCRVVEISGGLGFEPELVLLGELDGPESAELSSVFGHLLAARHKNARYVLQLKDYPGGGCITSASPIVASEIRFIVNPEKGRPAVLPITESRLYRHFQ